MNSNSQQINTLWYETNKKNRISKRKENYRFSIEGKYIKLKAGRVGFSLFLVLMPSFQETVAGRTTLYNWYKQTVSSHIINSKKEKFSLDGQLSGRFPFHLKIFSFSILWLIWFIFLHVLQFQILLSSILVFSHF